MHRGRYALAAAVLFACSGEVNSEPPAGSSGGSTGASAGAGAGSASVCDGVTCDPSLAACPAVPPTEGAACEPGWGYCAYYASGDGCPSSVWRCVGQWKREEYPAAQACPVAGAVCRFRECQQWQTVCGDDHRWSLNIGCDNDTCESCCQAAYCPNPLPTPGESCYIPDGCASRGCPDATVETSCGLQTASPSCWENVWQAQTACDCYEASTPEECSHGFACWWLEAGCAEPTLPAGGCYPVGACDDDTCPPGRTCAATSAVLCTETAGCEECDMVYQLCR